MERRVSGPLAAALVALAAGLLAEPVASRAAAGGEDGDAPDETSVERILVVAHRDRRLGSPSTTRRRRPRRRPAERSRPVVRSRALLPPPARRPAPPPGAAPRRASRLLLGRPVPPHRWSALALASRRGAEDEDPHWEAMLRTLRTVAPSRKDRLLLRGLLKRNPGAVGRLAAAPGEGARLAERLFSPASDEAPFGFLLERARRPPPIRPRHDAERLLQHFAENLRLESERSLGRIRLEIQLHRINTSRFLPGDPEAEHASQEFLDGYLGRRGPRSVYTASFSTAKETAAIEEAYAEVLAFRNRYLNFSLAYGGYDAKASIRAESDATVSELADRQEERLVLPDETIEEELERRRLSVVEELLSPFKKGRVALRASPGGFGDWVELVWTTPNLEFKAGPRKMRVRLGGTLAGLDVASYSSARIAGWDGRTGIEVVRRIDSRTRLRLAAGINYGRNERSDRRLVDIFSVTSDPSYVYLTWERSF